MHWPLIGWVLKHGGIFGVKRGKADVAAIKTAMKYLKDGELLLMSRAPATRTANSAMPRPARPCWPCVPACPSSPSIFLRRKWFRWNPVVFGEAYYPKAPEGRKPTPEDYHAVADD